MYSIFALMGILLWSSISKTFFLPSLWTLESAQFVMTGYVMLGGAYALRESGHVRMDLFYGNWTPRTKAIVDTMTVFFLLLFLVVMLMGGWGSLSYSFEYNERSATAWRPLMWPIKAVMLFSIILMLLQTIADLIKNIARIRGVTI